MISWITGTTQKSTTLKKANSLYKSILFSKHKKTQAMPTNRLALQRQRILVSPMIQLEKTKVAHSNGFGRLPTVLSLVTDKHSGSWPAEHVNQPPVLCAVIGTGHKWRHIRYLGICSSRAAFDLDHLQSFVPIPNIKTQEIVGHYKGKVLRKFFTTVWDLIQLLVLLVFAHNHAMCLSWHRCLNQLQDCSVCRSSFAYNW